MIKEMIPKREKSKGISSQLTRETRTEKKVENREVTEGFNYLVSGLLRAGKEYDFLDLLFLTRSLGLIN